MCSLHALLSCYLIFFFFNDTATTEIYTLSLHDALPISPDAPDAAECPGRTGTHPAHPRHGGRRAEGQRRDPRSEEHTSELQSPCNLVCRLLLEKKKELPHCLYTIRYAAVVTMYAAPQLL